nr:unnamed protein product [Callosobruchus chinensis]
MGKKKSRSLVNGKQSSVATFESISIQPVPDIVPENEEAWLEYRKQSTYKLLQTEYYTNETNIKEAYNRYSDLRLSLICLSSSFSKIFSTKDVSLIGRKNVESPCPILPGLGTKTTFMVWAIERGY